MTLFEAARSVPALDVAERYAEVQTANGGLPHGRVVRFIRKQEDHSLILTESLPVGTNAKIVTEPAKAAKRICADYGIEYEHDMTRTQRFIP